MVQDNERYLIIPKNNNKNNNNNIKVFKIDKKKENNY